MRIIGKSKKKFIPPKPLPKVYCGTCKHFSGVVSTNNGQCHGCKHPSVLKTYDTPIEERAIYGDCMELNKHNDCPMYRKRTG